MQESDDSSNESGSGRMEEGHSREPSLHKTIAEVQADLQEFIEHYQNIAREPGKELTPSVERQIQEAKSLSKELENKEKSKTLAELPNDQQLQPGQLEALNEILLVVRQMKEHKEKLEEKDQEQEPPARSLDEALRGRAGVDVSSGDLGSLSPDGGLSGKTSKGREPGLSS